MDEARFDASRDKPACDLETNGGVLTLKVVRESATKAMQYTALASAAVCWGVGWAKLHWYKLGQSRSKLTISKHYVIRSKA